MFKLNVSQFCECAFSDHINPSSDGRKLTLLCAVCLLTRIIAHVFAYQLNNNTS